MFTIEMGIDAGLGTTVTTLDDNGGGGYSDVEVILYEDQVFIRQDDEDGFVQLINLSVQQMRDIVASMSLPEGAYYQEASLK